jgi:hypothetical protein
VSDRITRKTLEAVYATFVDVAKRAGFDTDGWRLEIGSRLNGNSFRHYTHKYPDGSMGSGQCNTEFRSFLGWTCREAYDVLSTRIDALRAVAEVRGSAADVLRIEWEHADRLYQDHEGEGYRAHRYALQAAAKRLGFTLSDG